jgi:CBS domain-containing protein
MSWKVGEVMTRKVVAVRPQTGFKELVALMNEHAIGALPVVDVLDSDGRLVGMVAQSDLLAKQRVRGERPPAGPARPDRRVEATTAEDLMTTPVATLLATDPLRRAARLMLGKRIRHLPVIDTKGRLVGIVSRGDLLKPYLRSDESIRLEVAAAVLDALLGLPAGAVEVAVEDGAVTLRGEVANSAVADAAVRLARAVEGVVAVHGLDFRHDSTAPGRPPRPGVRGSPAAEWRADALQGRGER